MASFEIHGGKPLKGELVPQGAKNEALQVLCAPLLTDEKVTISNLPDIVDVNKLINLLQAMGVKVEKVEKGTYIFQAKDIDLDYLQTDDFKDRASSLRGSVMIVGPLLARFGVGYLPKWIRTLKGLRGLERSSITMLSRISTLLKERN